MNKWNKAIDQNTNDFIAHFGELSEELMNWKPNPNTWSIAQNIDHIIKVNQSYFPIFKDLKNGNYDPPIIGKVGFLVSFFGNMILRSVDPSNRKRVTTFSIWEPRNSEISKDIMVAFQSHQIELKKKIEGCKDLIKSGAVISSPANKNIVYKLEAAFDIIVMHEKRHLEQAKEVLFLLEN